MSRATVDDDLYRGYDDNPLNASGGGIFQAVGMDGEMLPGTGAESMKMHTLCKCPEFEFFNGYISA
ncbi:hypothetical protein DUNSADRAFT_14810 [Dunaliella salina]|uniref:Encoded protein n=1 Tax=Dunaliella salina TaxID=3046 RepID=A0ABQ7G6N4_DUNSA|nr:hypothetical protein DUNSADRAFT_14810 [Dunaliella salina]|eukprot:KAF5830271.1 hypothetical protein DUNSADRAFT_14810 [Dunaliella salina]